MGRPEGEIPEACVMVRRCLPHRPGRSGGAAARNRRRTVLRTTAGPRARPTEKATRGGVDVPGGANRTLHHNAPARARRPSVDRRPKTLRARMRQIKPTGGGGPWRGGPSGRPGRPGCSSGRGSRASWRGGGCWAEKCASRGSPRGSGQQVARRSMQLTGHHAPQAGTCNGPRLRWAAPCGNRRRQRAPRRPPFGALRTCC